MGSTARPGYTANRLATAHAGFFLIAGLWPLLHIGSFQWVTGPKTDTWLVKTVGTLIAVAGAVSLNAARSPRPLSAETVALLNGISASLGYISFHYARQGRISRIYYLDALAEAALLATWAAVLAAERAEKDERKADVPSFALADGRNAPRPAFNGLRAMRGQETS